MIALVARENPEDACKSVSTFSMGFAVGVAGAGVVSVLKHGGVFLVEYF